MRGSRTLLQVLGIFCASGAFAAELDLVELKSPQFVPPSPTWSVVGSLSPTYTENALFSRDNRRRDVYYEPDVSLRLDGSLSPTSPTASLPEPNTKPLPTNISAMPLSHAWARS